MDVKKIATDLIAKHKTNDPFTIADLRGINVLDCPMKSTLGYYTKYKRVQNIILNSNIPEALRSFVCAHELGHAICHSDLNTKWLKENTLFSVEKIEVQALVQSIDIEPGRFIRINHHYCMPGDEIKVWLIVIILLRQ